MNINFKSLILVALIFTYTLNVNAILDGGVDAGGSDFSLLNNQGTAWFLSHDKERTSYCIETEEELSSFTTTISKNIEESFLKWKNYVITKNVFNDFEKLPIVFNTTYVQNCDNDVDLKFYFGIKNSYINQIKKNYLNPLAFAFKEKDKSKGFIWFAPMKSVNPKEQFPDWKNPIMLKTMIMHEIGHVLGNKHISKTIMDDKIAVSLFLLNFDAQDERLSIFSEEYINFRLEQLAEIDQEEELATCMKCEINQQGSISGGNLDHDKMIFKLLANKNPLSRILAKLNLEKMESIESKRFGQLIIDDGLTTHKFKITLNYDSYSSIKHDKELFKIIPNNDLPFSGYKYSLSIPGEITTSSGTSLPITFEQNMSYDSTRIDDLFDMSWTWFNFSSIKLFVLHKNNKMRLFGGKTSLNKY